MSFIIKSKKTGKYLKRHSGSFNRKEMYTLFDVEKEFGFNYVRYKKNKTEQDYENNRRLIDEVHNRLFSAENALDARQYANIGAVRNSLGNLNEYDVFEIKSGELCLLKVENDHE